ncbi:unnamed protein product [Ceutorhynchus assimilis]|uniref:Gamma-interferon-inducible lysosomal thiol reductase n=1 Tax=Ceutorhynchus assimilis TaxID=467358 RepID=A0A9N9MG79_9CUCU|nr:unnamed protein product [Ceutorhynchus assimilis]
MLNKKQVIFCCMCLLIVHSEQQKINVAVYFESLCPDSQKFIIDQLYPNWDDIRDYINIKFIPFGKSISLDNGTKFACQHGSQECKGNRIMSCALREIPNQDLQVEYLRCFMDVYKFAKINDSENGQKCAQLLGLDYNRLMYNCYQTKEGTNLQLQAEIETNAIQPQFVPTIVYNGVFDQKLQDSSILNFRDTVCSLIRQIYPEGCSYRTVVQI